MRFTTLAICTLALLTLTVDARTASITAYSLDGNVGAEVAAFATPGSDGAGSLVLGSIPVGATIEQAYLYTNNYFNATITPSAIFAGTPLGSTAVYASDAGFSVYRWDVTSLITGNGAYAASYSGTSNSYGLALAVVYSDPSLPQGRATINDGAIDVVGPTQTSIFSAFGGPGTLWIHTLADNAQGQSGEQILMNGGLVGGPIDANLGSYASLFQLPVTTMSGLNTVSIVDPQFDQFGWDLAVLVSEVPEPGTMVLFALGALGVAGFARRRRKLSA